MDLIVPGNGLIIRQVVGLIVAVAGISFFSYLGYLAVKALRKYTAKS